MRASLVYTVTVISLIDIGILDVSQRPLHEKSKNDG